MRLKRREWVVGDGRSASLGGARVRYRAFMDTTRPRSKEGAHPDRISTMRNTVTPMRSALLAVGQAQARPNSSAGTGCSQKRRPAAERQGECITRRIGLMASPKGC